MGVALALIRLLKRNSRVPLLAAVQKRARLTRTGLERPRKLSQEQSLFLLRYYFVECTLKDTEDT